jgi:Tol biopolymer transport system component/DNA-binding winged helix-turn-helix (wHTH) protein
MAHSSDSQQIVRFAGYELDLRTGELRTNHDRVLLQEKPFQVLAALLEHPGEMVSREELARRLWPTGTFVDFNLGLNKTINRLRKVLDDSSERPQFIETLPKRGYRFVGAILPQAPAQPNEDSPSVANHVVNGHKSSSSRPLENELKQVTQVPRAAPKKESLLRTAVFAALGVTVALGFSYGVHTWKSHRLRPNLERLQLTKLTDSGTVGLAAISPDGQYVCYSLQNRGGWGLRLHHIATHSETEILATSASQFVGLTFSPNGNYIYYVRSDNNDPGFKYLYVMPVLGGPSRLLVKGIDSAASFSPDGTQFVYTRGVPRSNAIEIRITNADGSGNRLLATVRDVFTGFQHGAAWSPDGRTIVLSLFRIGTRSFTLDAVSLSDGGVHEFYHTAREIGRPLWLPEGDTLALVMEDQNGRGQLWTIDYPGGEVRRVTNGLTDYRLNATITRDGKTVSAVPDQITANIWEAQAGTMGEARQITFTDLPLFDANEAPGGGYLAAGRYGKLWRVRGSDGHRSLFSDVNTASQPTPCGRYVAFTVAQATATEIVRVDGEGANPTRLAAGNLGSIVCTRDGKYVFYVDLGPPRVISRVPIEGGSSVKIAEVLGQFLAGRLAISPDDKYLAFPYEEYAPTPMLKLAIVPTGKDARKRTIARLEGIQAYGALAWAPDGTALQYGFTQNGECNIWEQPLDGSKPRQLTTFASGQIFDFHWSRDGKRLLMSRGEISSDVVLISNLR